jgi:formate dehydrogenase subunit delta
MHIEQLVRMANDIGAFFQSEPSRDAAIHAIADHLKRFWDPRMRKQIIQHFNEGGDGLADLPRASISLLAKENASFSQCGDG